MPGPLLFDYTRLDKSATALTQDEIALINPQTGDMRQIDRIIWLNDDATECFGVKEVRDDEFWVPGHIPGRPLLPGVMMIEAAAQLCSVLHHKRTGEDRFVGFTRCQDVAFRGQVTPGQTLYLLAKEIDLRPRRFISDTQGFVDDVLVFQARITGMVI